MHEYYTPKVTKFQADLSIFTIFVDYADFYVNMVMSTKATVRRAFFTIFDDSSRCRGRSEIVNTKCSLCRFSCINYKVGK